jgi:hypothetical protein
MGMMALALKATVEIDCLETETICNRFRHTRGMCRQQGDQSFDPLTFHDDGNRLKIDPPIRVSRDSVRFSVSDRIIRKR